MTANKASAPHTTVVMMMLEAREGCTGVSGTHKSPVELVMCVVLA